EDIVRLTYLWQTEPVEFNLRDRTVPIDVFAASKQPGSKNNGVCIGVSAEKFMRPRDRRCVSRVVIGLFIAEVPYQFFGGDEGHSHPRPFLRPADFELALQ